MHAATRIEAEDRAMLERICRYVTRPSLAVLSVPRIHHRLPYDLCHRYHRYRLGDLNFFRGRCGSGYGGHAQRTAGHLVGDAFDVAKHSDPL